jgi:hypothetical protein
MVVATKSAAADFRTVLQGATADFRTVLHKAGCPKCSACTSGPSMYGRNRFCSLHGFLPAFVRTYNAGLSFALLLFFFLFLLRRICSEYSIFDQFHHSSSKYCFCFAFLSNFTMLSAYCTIEFSLARQPCPAALHRLA